ncbi:unnamed protein product [Umbelopsis vinacea]
MSTTIISPSVVENIVAPRSKLLWEGRLGILDFGHHATFFEWLLRIFTEAREELWVEDDNAYAIINNNYVLRSAKLRSYNCSETDPRSFYKIYGGATKQGNSSVDIEFHVYSESKESGKLQLLAAGNGIIVLCSPPPNSRAIKIPPTISFSKLKEKTVFPGSGPFIPSTLFDKATLWSKDRARLSDNGSLVHVFNFMYASYFLNAFAERYQKTHDVDSITDVEILFEKSLHPLEEFCVWGLQETPRRFVVFLIKQDGKIGAKGRITLDREPTKSHL